MRVERNRNSSIENNLFGQQSLLEIFLLKKSLQEREQNKRGKKEVLIQNGCSGLEIKVKASSNLKIPFEGAACVLLEAIFYQSL